MDPKTEIQELKKEVKRLNDILFGNLDDTRFQAKVRKQVVGDEHSTGKPTIHNSSGKKYKLQIV